jgi:starch synthase
MENKKFLLSTHGTFHYFDLAKELILRNALTKIISGYPKFKLNKYDLESEKIHATGFYQILTQLLGRYKFSNKKILDYLALINCKKLDLISSNYINDSNIFLGLSGTGLSTGQKFVEAGKIYICERASAHAQFCHELYKEEYDRFNYKFHTSSELMERELEEYQKSSFVLLPSEFAQKTFENKGFFNTKVIDYPANDSHFFPIPELKGDKNQFNILYVGGLTIRKGLEYLIDAFNKIKFKNKVLHLVGTKTFDFKFIENKIDHQHTIIYGHLDQSKINELMNKSQLFVLPSLQDGSGIVVSQALKTGLPVIVSENTGIKSLIKKNDCGYVVPIRDYNILSDKIDYLIENPNQLELFSTNAINFSKNHTWKNYVDQLNQIIDNFN